jgi:site-specific DNA-methyltransferase (adenine-specific)
VKVEWVGIEKLKPYWRNPRRRSEDSIRKIADSIAAFGWQQPIVVDKEFVVIIGHLRVSEIESNGRRWLAICFSPLPLRHNNFAKG